MVKDAKILLLGVTFKENCPDIRNTKVVDIYHTLEEYTKNIVVYDPWANAERVRYEYGIALTEANYDELKGQFDAVILCVAHNEFKDKNVRELLRDEVNGVLYDVKSVLPIAQVDSRL